MSLQEGASARNRGGRTLLLHGIDHRIAASYRCSLDRIGVIYCDVICYDVLVKIRFTRRYKELWNEHDNPPRCAVWHERIGFSDEYSQEGRHGAVECCLDERSE